ncbi:MAG: acyl-CoA thioesterase [Pseudodesulfovibrio sp.]|uniref:Thioesterase superfamily protein n=1 Tax=Pseudodesulfovibrio aespoeensis (strain ATCC 700646 / DSM 10631 / Aspo-2) TaxID=643562 RepID=E6VZZ0_PSEA9|nr:MULTISPECIES: acyl-CoA thioesterase [Pseudodesulfovibrio]MBU4192511.1 acyl-CoA thioesterase [Pseudomonadota bacterium]ADU64072.1 thioesterase superfamily protein [Pseudodesulfovibrio aespoeensis Aspo-2]MBU4244812.1 acyl-CoA thioesterase [Pseudomonadota bacterium]MBU4378477.1 acyl-CoA thioesterase [Pseudomonadota bacterium]MBU4476550.1 acyl-CoA thioesterase [Pseudomonadota bacterium]
MKPKSVKESEVIMTHLVLPQDANPAGNLHGGVILRHIDTTAGVVAKRHTRGNVVTVSIDRMAFKQPAYMGELLTFKASLNHVGRSSMEIGVRVEAENLRTGEVRHTNSAYLTFVALDDNGKPTPVPPLLLDTPTAQRRHREAELRRELRQRERALEEGREPHA